MAQGAAQPLLFPQANQDLQLLCCTASSLKQIKMIETEFIGAVPLFALANARTPAEKTAAQEMLNTHMEDFMDIMDDEEEFSEKIAFENSFPSLGLGEVDTNFDPVLKGETPRIAVRLLAQAQAQAIVNTGVSEYTSLITFINYFGVVANITLLKNLMQYMNILLYAKFSPIVNTNIRIYNNIYFVKNPVYDNSVFPKFSFYIVCKKEPLLQSQLLGGRENGMGALLKSFVCVKLKNFFTDHGFHSPDFVGLKIIEPTESSHLWQVKLSIFGNDFIFISIQIINMADGYFTIPQSQPVDYDIMIQAVAQPLTPVLPAQVLTLLDTAMVQQPATLLLLNIWQNLCFSLYNKCLSKDFNCLCSLSESDIKLYQHISGFPRVYTNQRCVGFYQFINHFWTYLFDSQLRIKQTYFYLGLNNLVYCSCQSDYTPETKAYEKLFDKPNLQAPANDDTRRYKNLFVNSMRLIEYVNAICNTIGVEPEKIRFVMGGGKQYSLFQKALNKFFSILGEDYFIGMFNLASFAAFRDELRHGNVKAAADADFGMFYPDGAIGATQCMAVCMLLQLSLKVLFNNLLTATTYEIDIGNSCIGTPPTTLSSLREVIVQSNIYYPIDVPGAPGYDAFTHFAGILHNFDTEAVKSTISPFDFVQKGSMVSYIKHIIRAVCDYIPQVYADVAANTVAVNLSSYCMITTQGFSSPLKGIFDIFYTLFIIENFTNRALVTQKINKELRRVAICAQVLYIHYKELLTRYPGDAAQINPMLATLTEMITYGYTQNISLMNQNNFQTIMTTYCEFINRIIYCAQTYPIFLYYCIVPPVFPPDAAPRALTDIETFFNSLLENSYNGAPDLANPLAYPSKVLPPQITPQTLMTVDRDANFAAKIIPCLHSINPVLTQLQAPDPAIALYVTLLYNNKLYAACRDSKNKSEGIVAIMSAYQSFLWDIRKRDRICPRIGEEHYVDLCGQLTAQADLLHSYNSGILDGLIGSLNLCWAPGLNLLDLTGDNTLDGIRFNPDMNDNKIKFLFFSWFITSIFGIKTKSKNTKVVSLGRTYLKLFMESHQNIETILFGCRVRIPLLAAVAAAAQARLQVVPYDPPYDPGDTFPCNDLNILCLAYKDSNIRDALTKYRESQDRLGGVGSGIVSVKKIQHAPLVIGIMYESLVFNNELVGLLIGRFSKLPRGQEFIHRTANKMKIIMDHFLDNIPTTPVNIPTTPVNIPTTPVNATSSLFDIVNHCLLTARVDVLTLDYTPPGHDISKFDDLPNIPGLCSAQDLRNRWVHVLIHCIINVFSVSTAPVDEIAIRTLFNYIRLLIVLYKHLNITQESLGLIQYANRTNTQHINLDLILGVKEEVNKVFKVACVKERPPAQKDQSALVKAKNIPVKVESSAARKAPRGASAAKVPKSSAVKAATKATESSAVKAAESSAAKASAAKARKKSTVDLSATDKTRITASKVSASRASAAKGAAAAAAARALSEVPEEDGGGGAPPNRGTIRIQNHRSPKKTNNHTRKRQYSNSIHKRKKNKSKPNYKNINPPSQSRSQHNRKKSNSKLKHKNVTFKRRRHNNKNNK
jgi:hypothetical protein